MYFELDCKGMFLSTLKKEWFQVQLKRNGFKCLLSILIVIELLKYLFSEFFRQSKGKPYNFFSSLFKIIKCPLLLGFVIRG